MTKTAFRLGLALFTLPLLAATFAQAATAGKERDRSAAPVGHHAHLVGGRLRGPGTRVGRRNEDHRVPRRAVQGGGTRAGRTGWFVHAGGAARAHAGAGRRIHERHRRRQAAPAGAATGHGRPRPAARRSRRHPARAAGVRRLRRARTGTWLGRLQGRRPARQGRRVPGQRSGFRGRTGRRCLRQVRRQGRHLLRALDLQVRRGGAPRRDRRADRARDGARFLRLEHGHCTERRRLRHRPARPGAAKAAAAVVAAP